MLLSNRTVGGSHHRLRDAANILEEEEEENLTSFINVYKSGMQVL